MVDPLLENQEEEGVDSSIMDEIGTAVLDSAKDVVTGRNTLYEMYNEIKWKEPEVVISKLTQYGTQLRHKFEDSTNFEPVDLLKNAPKPYTEMEDQEGDSATSKVDRWEAENLKLLENTTDPAYAVVKDQLERDIPETANLYRRVLYSEDAKAKNIDTFGETLGPVASRVEDSIMGFGRGFTAPFSPLVKAGTLGFVDINDKLSTMDIDFTEYDDNGKPIPKSTMAKVVEATPEALGNVAAQLYAFIPAFTGNVLNAGESVIDRGVDTYKNTGSLLKAGAAASIEAGAQAVDLGGDLLLQKVPGVSNKVLGKGFVEGVTKYGSKGFSKVPTFLKKPTIVAGAGLSESTTETGAHIISNVAENIEDPSLKDRNIFRGADVTAITSAIAGSAATTGRIYDLNIEGNQISLGNGTINNEVKELGFQVTPQERQNVGSKKATTVEEELDVADSTVDSLETEGEVETRETFDAESAPFQPTEHHYTTRDGSRYFTTEEGYLVKEGQDGTYELPFEFTSFVSPQIAAELKTAIENGAQIRTNDSGKMEVIYPGMDPIEVETVSPSKDAWLIGHDRESNINRNEKVRNISDFLTNKVQVTEVTPLAMKALSNVSRTDGSIGAAYAGKYGAGVKETETTRRRREGYRSPGGSINIKGDPSIEPVMYSVFPVSQQLEEARGLVPDTESAFSVYKSFINNDTKRDYIADPKQKHAVGFALAQSLDRAHAEAVLNNDVVSWSAIDAMKSNVMLQLSETSNVSATNLQTNKEAMKGSEFRYTKEKYDTVVEDSFQSEVAKEANQSDATIDEVINSEQDLAATEKEIAQVESIINEESLKGVDQEYDTLNEAVESMEQTAQETLEDIRQGTETEIQNLESEIENIQKEDAKQADSNIAILNNEIAKDTETLINLLGQDADTTATVKEGVTSEKETSRASEEQVITEANAAVKQAVVETRKAEADAITFNKDKLKLKNNVAKNRLAKFKQDTKAIHADKSARLDAAINAGDQAKANKYEAWFKKYNEKLAKLENEVNITNQAIINYEKDLLNERGSKEYRDKEELLNTLEQGVEIKRGATGKAKPKIVAKANNSLNLTKLLKSQDKIAKPLSALVGALSNISSLVNEGSKASTGNNKAINDLRAKISATKAVIDKLESNKGASSKSVINKIKAKQKALEAAKKANKEATTENYWKANPTKRKKYNELKLRRANRTGEAKSKLSDREKAARERLKELDKQKRKQEKLVNSKNKAREKALFEGQQYAKVMAQVAKLDEILTRNAPNLDPETRKRLIDQQLKLTLGKDLDRWYTAFVTGIVANPGNVIQAGGTSLLAPILAPISLSGRSVGNILNKFTKDSRNKVLISEFLLGFIGTKHELPGRLRDVTDALRGKRRTTILGSKDLRAISVNVTENQQKDSKKEDSREDLEVKFAKIEDYLTKIHNLKFPTLEDSKNIFEAFSDILYYGHSKVGGYFVGATLRLLSTIDAIQAVTVGRGLERAAMAEKYNEAIAQNATDAELDRFIYDLPKKRSLALADAKQIQKDMRNAGTDLSDLETRELADKIYQNNIDRNVLKETYKTLGEYNFNAPATGVGGVGVDVLRAMDSVFANLIGGRPLKWALPVANATGIVLDWALKMSPAGMLTTTHKYNPLGYNKTPLQASMARSTSMVFTTALAGGVVAALGHMELPEDEQYVRFVRQYSKDKKLQKAFLQNGGKLDSVGIKLGGEWYYIPFGETLVANGLRVIGHYADQKRDNKDMDFSLIGILGTAMTAPLSFSSNVSMTKHITDMFSTILEVVKDEEMPVGEKTQRVAYAVAGGPIKGLIPSSGNLRYFSRYTDVPVDSKNDFVSYMVSGIPVVQSALGKPALNLFGEDMKPIESVWSEVHRMFSKEGNDQELRWLIHNRYTIPDPKSSIRTSRTDTTVPAYPIAEEDRYEIFKNASSEIRKTVRNTRLRNQNKPYSPHIQKQLTSDINGILNKYQNFYVRSKGYRR